jgi:hypothetical protein
MPANMGGGSTPEGFGSNDSVNVLGGWGLSNCTDHAILTSASWTNGVGGTNQFRVAGGGGYYGGGGAGVNTIAASWPRAAGGGSGYVNPALVIAGVTIRGNTVSASAAPPPGVEHPQYISPRGSGGYNAIGADGHGVIQY